MTDKVDSKTRSRMMRSVRTANTTPELTVWRFLHRQGFRYRLHVKDLPGKLDIVLPKYKTAIFVNGCFWHGHDCPKGKLPSTNRSFWQKKIDANRQRDQRDASLLRKGHWKVEVIWECKITEAILAVTAGVIPVRVPGQNRHAFGWFDFRLRVESRVGFAGAFRCEAIIPPSAFSRVSGRL